MSLTGDIAKKRSTLAKSHLRRAGEGPIVQSPRSRMTGVRGALGQPENGIEDREVHGTACAGLSAPGRGRSSSDFISGD